MCDHEDKNLGDNIPCPGFELSDEQLKHTINDLNDVILSIKNKGSLYLEIGATIATIALLIWLGLEARLEWLIISIFVILAICISVFVVSHKKSRKYELEVIKRMVKLRDYAEQFISKERIVQLLTNMGYAPRQLDDDALIFKYGDLNMIIDYSDGFLAIQVSYGLSDEDKAYLGTLSICADEYMKATQLIKVQIIDDAIIYIIKAHMLYMDELERYFERFAHWLSNANKYVITRYVKLKEPAFERIFIYSLAYRLIPLFVRCVSQKEVPISALWNEEAMKNELRNKDRYVNEAELTKFRVLSVSDYGEIKQVVYQFPEPQIAPEAKYGAVLVNTRTLECQYYTLEMSDNDLWFYCGVNENKQHLNYGEAKNSDLDSFLTWVLSDNKIIEAQSLTR